MCLPGGYSLSWAQTALTTENVRAARTGDSVRVQADVALQANAEVATDRILSMTLRIVGQNDSVQLPAVYVLGRMPYYRYARGRDPAIQRGDAVLRDKTLRELSPYHYDHKVAYQSWMDRAVVRVIVTEHAGCTGDDEDFELSYDALQPTMVLVNKEVQVDTVSTAVHGTVYINFELDSINIKPTYMANPEQLDKIRAALDSVRSDTTVTLKLLTIKGYASPEGRYAHNKYLARERTYSLRNYIMDTYGIPGELIRVDYEPEDWDGLRRMLAEATTDQLPHRQQLLDIANSDLKPDEKERLMRTRYPRDFRVMLRDILPYLRHSDYTIEYTWQKTSYTPERVDTIYQMPTAGYSEAPPATAYPREKRFRPIVALKTNALFDLAMAFNFEIEAQLGPDSRWSIMVEDWFPWFLFRRDYKGDTNEYRRSDWKAWRSAYEIWTGGAELRYWFRPKCTDIRPPLTGTFVGAYIATGKYDWEWDGEGDQGEFTSFGATYGRSWVLSRRWNLELSGSVGYVRGPRRHYIGMFDNSRLIWQYTSHLNYIGPTKLKLSLVWLLGPKKKVRYE